MSNQRLANEQVLARHRFKRLRGAVGKRSVDQASSSVLDVVSPLTSSTAPVAVPSIIVFPPIGTTRSPQSDTLSTTSNLIFDPSTASLPASTTPSSTLPLPSHSSSVLTPSTSTSTHLTPPTSSSLPSVLLSTSSATPVTSSPGFTSTAGHTVSSATPGQSDTQNSDSPASSLSSGAVGGIVAAILIFALAIVGFFVRRRAKHRRAVKRNTWGAGLVPALEDKRGTMYAGQLFAGQSALRPSDAAPDCLDNIPPNSSTMSQLHPALSIPSLAAPASSYNPGSPASPIVPTSLRGVPSLRSVAPSTPSSSSAAPELAVVARTFIPSLPDELQIANGEQIRILTPYDDGWALCSNLQGDQGVVPLECLQRVTSVPTDMQLQPQSHLGGSESIGTLKRMSSLTPNAPGTY